MTGSDAALIHATTGMIAAIGGAAFPARFLDAMRALAGVELCSVFRRERGRPVELLFAAGETPHLPDFARSASREYARIYWRSDSQLGPLWRAQGHRPVIMRQRASEIADPGYRATCYDRAGVSERLSVLWPGEPCFAANGYRIGTAPSPSAETVERLERHAGLLLATLRQHCRATAASGHMLDEQDLLERLLALGSGLSLREAEVAAALILGETHERIAAAKRLSPATIVTYRRRAYGKLGVVDRRGLVALHRRVIAGG